MPDLDLTPLQSLAEGLVDPAAPDQLPAELRGEGGVRILEWLQAAGVDSDALLEAEAVFRNHAEQYLAELGWDGLKSDLNTLIYERDFDAAPPLAIFLREAVRRVDGPQQWAGLLRLLHRLAILAAFPAAGEPRPPGS